MTFSFVYFILTHIVAKVINLFTNMQHYDLGLQMTFNIFEITYCIYILSCVYLPYLITVQMCLSTSA